MRKGKIDKKGLEQDLAAGMSGAQAAKKYGVSEAAVSYARKRIEGEKELVVSDVPTGKMNPLDQLQQINQKTNALLDRALRSKKDVTAINALKEIRGQVNTALEVAKALNDFGATQQFFEEILMILGEVEPDVRDKIIKRLKDKQSLRQAINVD